MKDVYVALVFLKSIRFLPLTLLRRISCKFLVISVKKKMLFQKEIRGIVIKRTICCSAESENSNQRKSPNGSLRKKNSEEVIEVKRGSLKWITNDKLEKLF